MTAEKENSTKKRLIDRLSGDKIVWLIILFLCLYSLLSSLSSTSLLATLNGESRLVYAKNQLITIAVGMVIIFVFYKINRVRILKFMSRQGFWFSTLLLILLVGLAVLQKKGVIPEDFIIRSVSRNNARRWLSINGVEISIFEVIKVAMVMYIALMIDRIKNGETKFIDKLSELEHFEFLKKTFWKEFVCLFIPTMLTSVLVLTGGTSSAVFLAGILFLTMLLGQVDIKHLFLMGLVAAGIFVCCFGLYSATKSWEHPLFERIGTFASRMEMGTEEYARIVMESEKKDKTFYDALDKIRQPYGAKIAVKEGGLFGKGPGQSTQKYKVSVIYEDYVFSFLVEEYGLVFGGIPIIILYLSLLARGSVIARNCQNHFAKTVVAGLTALISCQALFHILINCHVGLMTGQTLPLISHGRSSFWCFCVAFGVILSISRMAEEQIAREAASLDPLLVIKHDETKESLSDLERLESGEIGDNDIY